MSNSLYKRCIKIIVKAISRLSSAKHWHPVSSDLFFKIHSVYIYICNLLILKSYSMIMKSICSRNFFILVAKRGHFTIQKIAVLFCPIFLISSYINYFIYSPIHFAFEYLIKIDPQLLPPLSLLYTNIQQALVKMTFFLAIQDVEFALAGRNRYSFRLLKNSQLSIELA